MIEEVGSVKANSTTDSQAPVKRKRGRPPKNQSSLISEDLRDLRQKRAQKLLKEALKQVCVCVCVCLVVGLGSVRLG